MAATTITSVQRPTFYSATHGDDRTREYNPTSFKFVPIPNNQATSEDLVYDLSCTNYYNIVNKCFYSNISIKGNAGTENVLDDTNLFNNGEGEHVLYAVPTTDTNVIYKVKHGTTEIYKCSDNDVKTLSLGNAELSGKSINTLSMQNAKIYLKDGDELCSIDASKSDDNNSVNSINSNGFIYVEVPKDLEVDYIEVKANVLYLKGTFNTGNSAFSNLYVCKYPDENNEDHCIYSGNSVFPVSVVSLNDNVYSIKLENSTAQFNNERWFSRKFLEVNGVPETDQGVNLSEWESTGIKTDSIYRICDYTSENLSGDTFTETYVRLSGEWYPLSATGFKYSEGSQGETSMQPGSASPLDDDLDLDTAWSRNKRYLKQIEYKKKVQVEDATDKSKKGTFSYKNGQFEPNPTIPHSSELQIIIKGILDNPTTGEVRYQAVDTDNKLVIDLADNKVIFNNTSLDELNYRLENTAQDPGAGA